MCVTAEEDKRTDSSRITPVAVKPHAAKMLNFDAWISENTHTQCHLPTDPVAPDGLALANPESVPGRSGCAAP
jgi:hypothetical protein